MSPRRSSRGTLLLFLALCAIARAAWLRARARARRIAVVTTPGPVGTTSTTGSGAPSAGTAPSAGVVATAAALAALQKPPPVSVEYKGCPATRDGGDPALHALEARGDSTAFADVAFATIAMLPWPRPVERRGRRVGARDPRRRRVGAARGHREGAPREGAWGVRRPRARRVEPRRTRRGAEARALLRALRALRGSCCSVESQRDRNGNDGNNCNDGDDGRLEASPLVREGCRRGSVSAPDRDSSDITRTIPVEVR